MNCTKIHLVLIIFRAFGHTKWRTRVTKVYNINLESKMLLSQNIFFKFYLILKNYIVQALHLSIFVRQLDLHRFFPPLQNLLHFLSASLANFEFPAINFNKPRAPHWSHWSHSLHLFRVGVPVPKTLLHCNRTLNPQFALFAEFWGNALKYVQE